MAGELTTANYGWVKPTVGSSVDAWGGYLNTDLDGIDSTVHSIQTSVPAASSITPAMDGTAAAGTGTTFARADHVHPTDTSRYAATNPSGYQTAAQVTTSLGPYALIASPTFTGTPAAPTPAPGTNTTQLATTAFVTAATAGSVNVNPNRIDNGDMWVDQHSAGASVALPVEGGGFWTPDRWNWAISKASKLTIGQNYSTATKAPGFPYFLGVQTTTAVAAPAAGDYFYTQQGIEADVIGDFMFGTANAQPVTLSFWACSSLTGNFSCDVTNGTRSYIFTYSLPTANTWTKIIQTIPGDTTGTWTLTGASNALQVLFDFGSGTGGQIAASSVWQATGAWAASGAVKLVSTLNAKWAVTGVKLELGSVATAWLHEDLAKSLARCQRYYQSFTGLQVANYSPGAGGVTTATITYPPMRATPTATPTGQSYSNASALFVSPAAPTNAQTGVTAAAGGGVFCGFNLALSAEI